MKFAVKIDRKSFESFIALFDIFWGFKTLTNFLVVFFNSYLVKPFEQEFSSVEHHNFMKL